MTKDEIDYVKIIDDLQDACCRIYVELSRAREIGSIYESRLAELWQFSGEDIKKLIEDTFEEVKNLPDIKITKIDKDGDLR